MPDPVFIEQLTGALWVLAVFGLAFVALLAFAAIRWLIKG